MNKTEAQKKLRRKNIIIFALIGAILLLLLLISPLLDEWLPSPAQLFIFRNEAAPTIKELESLSLTPAWHYETDKRIRRIVGLTGNKLILYTYKEQFIALNIDTGKLAWSYQPSGPVADLETRVAIALQDGLLVFISYIDNTVYNKLNVLDADIGQKLWERDDSENGYATSTFAVGDKYIYWSLWPHYLAFDRYTGELAWQSQLSTGPGGYSGLLYDNGELTIVRPDMYVLDANNGEIKRRLDFKINSTAYKIYDGVIYFIFGKVQALDTKNNSVRWEKNPGGIEGAIRWIPMIKDNRLYLGLNGSLGALDARTGQIIWGKSEPRGKNEPFLSSNPAFVSDTIYAIFSDGSLRAFNDDDGSEMGRVNFGVANEDAALYATDDMLFVSLGDSRLYAYSFIEK
jgi:outer membrane protein assembly factor BamB